MELKACIIHAILGDDYAGDLDVVFYLTSTLECSAILQGHVFTPPNQTVDGHIHLGLDS